MNLQYIKQLEKIEVYKKNYYNQKISAKHFNPKNN